MRYTFFKNFMRPQGTFQAYEGTECISSLVERMTTTNPSDRPTAREALSDIDAVINDGATQRSTPLKLHPNAFVASAMLTDLAEKHGKEGLEMYREMGRREPSYQ
jgi:serine/threonine protein kinase